MGMDIGAMVESSRYTTRGANVGIGRGTCIVAAIKTFGGRKGPTFVAELLVEESSAESANKAGTGMSFVKVLAGQNQEFFAGQVKEFMEVLNDGPATKAAFDRASSEAQPLRGARIRYEAYADKKKNGESVTAVRWLPHPNTDADVASGLAALKAAGR